MSYISASGLSYKLPDTTILFSDLNFTFNRGRSAIVGKNGVGKTTLFRLIQNQLSPTAGAILNKAKFEVLPQDLDIFQHQDILDVLGVKRIYTAYLKIISGDYNESCYKDLNNRWDIENEITHSLSSLGLDKLDLKR
ncbi:MAG: ATP-binding cassette domain-containing protein, partial [Deltaproteobacteria bacterium]|nr:ATP-binding cassette domain-containing protein [Deltaproteobacteria bacterium]